MGRIVLTMSMLAGLVLNGADPAYVRAKEKVESIANDKASRGSTITLSPEEVNALARGEVRNQGIDGVQNPRVALGNGTATWSGLVNFAKVPQLQSLSSNWLLKSVLEGEKPVSFTVNLESAGGRATLNVQELVISETKFEGGLLDFVVEKLVLSSFPKAKIGEPFDLEHNVEQIRLQPSGVAIKIRN